MKKVLACIACLMMIIPLWGCSPVKDGDGQTLKKGETAVIDSVKSTLKEVTETEGSTVKAGDGNVFILCEVSVKNDTDKDVPVSSMMSFVCYVDGVKTDINFDALANKGDKEQMDGTIAAGKTLDGVLGYKVPKSWKSIKIEYTPNLVNSKKVTFTYEK